MAVATFDRLHHTSPPPFCRCRCFRLGQILIRNPICATYLSLVPQMQSNSMKALQSCCLLSSGTSPEFKQSAIDGAISSVAVSRSFRFRPSAVSVGWSNLFISSQTPHSSFWHLVVTAAMSPPSSSWTQYGQLLPKTKIKFKLD